MLYEIQPTGPARRLATPASRRLATQQVGYDQKGKSAVQRRGLQQHKIAETLTISFPRWFHVYFQQFCIQTTILLKHFNPVFPKMCSFYKQHSTGYMNNLKWWLNNFKRKKS